MFLYLYKNVYLILNILIPTCEQVLCISGVGSKMHTWFSYAAAIFPVSVLQSKQLILI